MQRICTFERDAFQVFIVWPHCISLLSSSSSTSWGATLLNLRLCFWILHNLSRDLFSIKTKSQVNVVVFHMNVTFRNNLFWDTPPKFSSSPLKSYRNPIGKDRLPFPPFFRWRLLLVSGRPPSLESLGVSKWSSTAKLVGEASQHPKLKLFGSPPLKVDHQQNSGIIHG